MESNFKEFKEIIEIGLQNNMPRDAKLIMVGQILNAVACNQLTIEEGQKLEEIMGGRKEWEEALGYAIFGYYSKDIA
ncbi:MAG: hypothetical protein H0X31_20950 [Nostocaceae cyanobacterium]|nr:hypothetical protein [Nostocaceae cyanobacterium]